MNDGQKRHLVATFRHIDELLAEDRLNLVVVGCLSRRRTSLMDAILGTDRLPTATILERISEDVRRYATKHDAIRGMLATEGETKAGYVALRILAGLRNVHMAGSTD